MAPIAPRTSPLPPNAVQAKTIVAEDEPVAGAAGAAAGASAADTEYTVKPGDSLWAIASRLKSGALGGGEYADFEVPELVKMLIEANPQVTGVDEDGKKIEDGKKRKPDGGLIYPGEKLALPELEDEEPPAPPPGPYQPNKPGQTQPPWNNGGPGKPVPPVAPNAGAPPVPTAAALEANAPMFAKLLQEPSGEYPKKVAYVAAQLEAGAEANPAIMKAPWFQQLAGMVETAQEQIETNSLEAQEMGKVLAAGEYDASQGATIHADVHARLKQLMPFVDQEVLKQLVPLLQTRGETVNMTELYAPGKKLGGATAAPNPTGVVRPAANAAAAAAAAAAAPPPPTFVRKFSPEVWNNMLLAAPDLPAQMAHGIELARKADLAGDPSGEQFLERIMASKEFQALAMGAQQAAPAPAAPPRQQQTFTQNGQVGRLPGPDVAEAARRNQVNAPPIGLNGPAATNAPVTRNADAQRFIADMQVLLDSGVASEAFSAKLRNAIELTKSPDPQKQLQATVEMRAISVDPELARTGQALRKKLGTPELPASVQALLQQQRPQPQ